MPAPFAPVNSYEQALQRDYWLDGLPEAELRRMADEARATQEHERQNYRNMIGENQHGIRAAIKKLFAPPPVEMQDTVMGTVIDECDLAITAIRRALARRGVDLDADAKNAEQARTA